MFNAGDALLVHNFNAATAQNKRPNDRPIRVLTFPGTHVTCHAHRPARRVDELDLLVGLATGEVVVASLRALVSETTGKTLPAGTLRFNTDGGGGVGGSAAAARGALQRPRCAAVAWRPRSLDADDDDGGDALVAFVSAHADERVRVLRRSRCHLGSVFSAHQGRIQTPCLAVRSPRGSASESFARWHLGAAPLRDASFSPTAIASSRAATVCVASWTCATATDPRSWADLRAIFGGLADGRRCGRGGRFVLAGGGRRTPSRSTTSRADASPRGRRDTPAGSRRRRRIRWRGRTGSEAAGKTTETTRATRRRVRSPGPGPGSTRDAFSSASDHRYDDLLQPNAPGEVLRFGSVGQDCRLCLWDLDVADRAAADLPRRLAGAHAAAHAASPARARAAAVHGAVRRAAVVVVVDALPERDDALGVQVDACDDGRRAEEFASESEPPGESRVESHGESSDVRGWRRAASVRG